MAAFQSAHARKWILPLILTALLILFGYRMWTLYSARVGQQAEISRLLNARDSLREELFESESRENDLMDERDSMEVLLRRYGSNGSPPADITVSYLSRDQIEIQNLLSDYQREMAGIGEGEDPREMTRLYVAQPVPWALLIDEDPFDQIPAGNGSLYQSMESLSRQGLGIEYSDTEILYTHVRRNTGILNALVRYKKTGDSQHPQATALVQMFCIYEEGGWKISHLIQLKHEGIQDYEFGNPYPDLE